MNYLVLCRIRAQYLLWVDRLHSPLPNERLSIRLRQRRGWLGLLFGDWLLLAGLAAEEPKFLGRLREFISCG